MVFVSVCKLPIITKIVCLYILKNHGNKNAITLQIDSYDINIVISQSITRCDFCHVAGFWNFKSL